MGVLGSKDLICIGLAEKRRQDQNIELGLVFPKGICIASSGKEEETRRRASRIIKRLACMIV
jgi:hypothetical protein